MHQTSLKCIMVISILVFSCRNINDWQDFDLVIFHSDIIMGKNHYIELYIQNFRDSTSVFIIDDDIGYSNIGIFKTEDLLVSDVDSNAIFSIVKGNFNAFEVILFGNKMIFEKVLAKNNDREILFDVTAFEKEYYRRRSSFIDSKISENLDY